MRACVKTKEVAMPRASRNHYMGHKSNNYGKSKNKTAEKNWMNDKRFHTLTALLGDRYSPHRQLERPSDAAALL